MLIKKVDIANVETIEKIVTNTIRQIYPRYYPAGAVDFFIQHHNIERIKSDVEAGLVYAAYDDLNHMVGTVTIKGNEICRLFVLPEYQSNGYGRCLLDFAEENIRKNNEILF